MNKLLSLILLFVAALAWSQAPKKITKSETEWKKELSEIDYYVLREKGTERAFTGKLWDNKKGRHVYLQGL